MLVGVGLGVGIGVVFLIGLIVFFFLVGVGNRDLLWVLSFWIGLLLVFCVIFLNRLWFWLKFLFVFDEEFEVLLIDVFLWLDEFLLLLVWFLDLLVFLVFFFLVLDLLLLFLLVFLLLLFLFVLDRWLKILDDLVGFEEDVNSLLGLVFVLGLKGLFVEVFKDLIGVLFVIFLNRDLVVDGVLVGVGFGFCNLVGWLFFLGFLLVLCLFFVEILSVWVCWILFRLGFGWVFGWGFSLIDVLCFVL